MMSTARSLAATVCIASGCVLAVPGVAPAQSAAGRAAGRTPVQVVAQTPAEGWSGQVQCLIASRGAGYQDDQTHTWVLSGAPAVRSGFRDYPATWTMTGNGRRTPVAARASAAGVGDSWTYEGSDPSASITLFVPVGTATIRIAGGQRAGKATNGIKGTAAAAPFAADVGEWRFQYIDVVNGAAQATLRDSRTQTPSGQPGWRPPPGTAVTETCSWNLTRSGPASGGAAATNAAAGAATVGRSAARGPVIPAGAAPAGGAASGGAANSGTTTSGSGAAPSSDVDRQYAAIGLTPAPGTGVVVATLVDDAGAPLVGVSVADIRLLGATSLPVGMGPYMFGATGDIVDSSTLSVTVAVDGRSRVAFLDVPVGTLTLTVIYSRDGNVVTRSAQVVTTAGGVTAVQP